MTKFIRVTSAIASLCLAAIPAVAVVTAAHAAPTPVVIKVNDLNLSRPGDAARFHNRVKMATRTFCEAERAPLQHRACQQAIASEALSKLSAAQRDSLRIGTSGSVLAASLR